MIKQSGNIRPKILIVEDEAVIAMDIRLTLESLNFITSGIAFSGEESIRKAAALRPDLILMDIKLKGDMNGILAAREIFRLYRIPVIYITAYSDPKTLDGMSPFAFLFKPFETGELKAIVRRCLGPAHRWVPA